MQKEIAGYQKIINGCRVQEISLDAVVSFRSICVTLIPVVVREGLRALLEVEKDFTIVGEAANGLQAVELARELRPAVVVLDIAMPHLNGLEAARQILQLPTPRPKVLILSAHGDEAYVEQVAALGAVGYLIKQSSAHILAKAIRDIHQGKRVYSPSIAKGSGTTSSEPGEAGGKNAQRLSPRQREVVQRIAEGCANKQVAAALGISIKTVEKHRQIIMQKLDIHDTAGLTRYAISAGIIENSVQSTNI